MYDEDERDLSEDEEIVAPENEENVDEEIDETDETENDEQEEKEETVPLKTYLELKNKYKLTRKEYVDLKDKALDDDLKAYKEEVRNKYVKGGYNEDLADMISEDFAKLKSSLNNSKSNLEDSILEEIEELKKDKLFADADDYRNEIINKIKETKRKGYDLDVEDAYIIVSRQGKNRFKEKKVNDTQRSIIERKNKGTVKANVATSGSSSTKSKYILDEHDKLALKQLQNMQPDAKWTIEKYYKTMKE
jgi:hypothetical protein